MDSRLTDPEDIRTYLMYLDTPLPEGWQRYTDLADKLGCRIHAVTGMNYGEIDIGTSPGDSWAYQGDLFIKKGEDPDCTVLHEVCHWMVAKQQGLQNEVNFGSSDLDDRIDDEFITCDAQIAWILVHRTPQIAWQVAQWLQYDTSDDTIRSTIESGCQQWASYGMPLEVSEDLLSALAREVKYDKTPNDIWGVPWNER